LSKNFPLPQTPLAGHLDEYPRMAAAARVQRWTRSSRIATMEFEQGDYEEASHTQGFSL